MKLLVVEDNPEIIEAVSLCFELRWSEVNVISTPSGENGIELATIQGLSGGLPYEESSSGNQRLLKALRCSDRNRTSGDWADSPGRRNRLR